MSLTILAIDPGTTESAWVRYCDGKILAFGKIPNAEMLRHVSESACSKLVVEMVASYGMPVGAEVFETVFWIGRFCEAWGCQDFYRLTRADVKMHLCHQTKGVNDSVIRQRLIDKYGGKDKAIGGVRCPNCKGKGWSGSGRPVCDVCQGEKWKHPPGPLHGITADVWQALAVAVTFSESL